MLGRDVQPHEVVLIVLKLGPLGHIEPKPSAHLDEFLDHARDDVTTPDMRGRQHARLGDIDHRASRAGAARLLLAGKLESLLKRLLDLVHALAGCGLVLFGNILQHAHRAAQPALGSKERNPPRLERIGITRTREGGQGFGLERIQFGDEIGHAAMIWPEHKHGTLTGNNPRRNTMTTITAMAASQPGMRLERREFQLAPLAPDQVEIEVLSCGICHSDLSMLNNDWGMTSYPLVPGHEVIGTVAAVGDRVSTLSTGQTVGLGWYSGSCMHCGQCMAGDHNLCGSSESTIVGRHGGFATRVRCKAEWAVPLPDGVDAAKAGPLFCGGITVFNPIVQMGVKPTDRVGVVGIGGLGHLAIQFLAKWGCHVTAFTSSDSKAQEAIDLGAHAIVNSRDADAIKAIAGSLDFIISTVNVPLDWKAYLTALAPRGTLHTVGAVLEPIPVGAFDLIMGQKQVSGSPLGSPRTTALMLDFCARHGIEAVTEHYRMSEANAALEHLHAGNARYRIILDNDLA